MEFDKSKVYTALNADEVKVGSKGCFADNIEDLKERVKSNCFYTLVNVGNENNAYRFKSDDTIGYFLFYLAEEPESNSEPKEVTATDWDNKPRIMKVWDDNYFEATKDNVVYIAPAGEATYPVIAFVSGNGTGEGHVCCYKHCAEIAATKEVKAEKHYRPYSNADEFIADYKRRFCSSCSNDSIPAIWVKNKVDVLKQVTSIMDEGAVIKGFIDYFDFLDTYTYPDGSPCGMEE